VPEQRTAAEAVRIFTNAHYPQGGLTATSAWLGIYQTLLWYEPVNGSGYTSLPHIIEANQLRPPARHRKKVKLSPRPSAWQKRAEALEKYLAQQLGCLPDQVINHVDQLMRDPSRQGLQRQNPLGIAFTAIVQYVLESFGSARVRFEMEVDANTIFPGIRIPGRSKTPSIDVVAFKNNYARAIISIKWSLRHDRINDITNECPSYKAAAMMQRRELDYYVVTNEYAPARLNKILSDPCINGVAHVHKRAVDEVCGLDGRLDSMLDLSDLVMQTHEW